MKRLKISIVSSHDINENDFKIRGLFNELFEELKAKFESFPYSKVDFINFSFNSEAEQIEQDCIVTLNPVKYILCKKELKDSIIPIAAIKKVHQVLPYYPAFFIANKNSSIDSIRSGDIKTLYTVSKNSSSGYIAPLFKLWQTGVIETSNESGVENIGWDLKTVGSHKEVEQRVLEDIHSIGATGQFTNQEDPQNALVKVLLRYYYLPQDVLVLSKNLSPYREYIEKWFQNVFSKDSEWISVFLNSSNRITGLYAINEEFQNALKELEIMTDYVHSFEEGVSSSRKGALQTDRSENLLISKNLKKLLAENKLAQVIKELNKHFDDLNDKRALKEVINYSRRIHEINEWERLELEDRQDITKEKNQLNRALLNFIDVELENV